MPILLLADSNALRHPGLERYFASSRDHWVLISDLTLVEMRKKEALSTSRDSLRIVSRYIDRTYVLRRTDLMLNENIRSKEDAEQLLDIDATLDLQRLCQQLLILPVPSNLRDRMAQQERDAQLIMQRLTDEVAELEPALIAAAEEFTDAEIRTIRTRGAVDDVTRRKVLDLLKETTADFVRNNQDRRRRKPMKVREALGLFAFRYSLCLLLYYLTWMQRGSQTKKLSRRVNDIVDLQLAVMSTYFNGALSRDNEMQSYAQQARAVLRGYGAFCGADWFPGDTAAAANGSLATNNEDQAHSQ